MFFRFTGFLKGMILSSSFPIWLTFFALFIQFSIFAQEFFNDLEDSIHQTVWINTQQIDSNSAYSGKYYSYADSAQPYGLGIESRFPENLQNKNIYLKVSGWVKTNRPGDHAQFVITLIGEDQQVYWQKFNLSPLLVNNDQWINFTDSARVPASVTNSGKFKAYLWNDDLKDTVAIDDLKITFTKMEMPSFIPHTKFNQLMMESGKGDQLFVNQFYKLYFLKQEGLLQIYSVNDSLLLNNIWFYTQNEAKEEKQVVESSLQFLSKSNGKYATVLKFKTRTKNNRSIIEFNCSQYSPEIQVKVTTRYNRDQQVRREAVVISSKQPVNEVFRANRKSDTGDFQEEYWLGHEGVEFGKGDESVIIYHATGLSSLQLQTGQNLLWANLDYQKDHPFLHFPLNNDTSDYFEDWSASNYQRGDRQQWSFSIYIGAPVNSLPRIMKNPGGYMATYIWTEHADFTDIRTNYATYYGSEKITNPDSAVGGFVKYRIPVTKSVFYSNPDSVTNSIVSDRHFKGLELSISGHPDYYDFLKHLREYGNEICLHSPDNFTTNRSLLTEALSFMKKEFHSKSWIDHGYNNGLQNNREDLVCDGTLKQSPYYAMDLWKGAGLKYFWNPYYEDNFTFEYWKFGEFIDQPYLGFGDRFPNPDYWTHPTRTGNLVHWPTKTVLYVPSGQLWDFYFNDQVLNAFADSWSVEINHCYPAWVDPEKGFWLYDNDSTIVAAPGFNRTLHRLSDLRDKKQVNVTTVEQFLDYQLALQKLAYQIVPDGRIKVTNNNQKAIIKLAFAAKAKEVVVNGLKPMSKAIGNDIIFWFDLAAGESKIMRIVN